MSISRFFSTSAACLLLAFCGTGTAGAALVSGDTITTSFISGGWSLSLTLEPSSPLVIGNDVEATFMGTQNFFLGPGSAIYTLNFFNDISGRSFLEMTAVFSNSPSAPPSIGANFHVGSLDFGPGFHLGGVVPVTGIASINSLTPSSFNFSTGGIVISTTPQTILMELVAVPELTTSVFIGLFGTSLLFRRRREGLLF